MREVLSGISGKLPIHIHIAEQMAEVNECAALRSARPVQWLMDHADVNQDWTLVHATHLDDVEVALIAKSKATVAICTTTEVIWAMVFFVCVILLPPRARLVLARIPTPQYRRSKNCDGSNMASAC